MLIIFNFDQSKNNSIYLYDIINLIWYYSSATEVSVKFEFSFSLRYLDARLKLTLS